MTATDTAPVTPPAPAGTPPTPRHVDIVADGTGQAQILIEGHDVAELVAAVDLQLRARELPALTLGVYAPGGVRYSGPALVALASTEVPPSTGIRAWLNDLDPGVVAGAIAERMRAGLGMGQGSGVGDAALAALHGFLDAAGVPR